MHDDVTVAALLAISIGLLKIVEKVIEWGFKKVSERNGNAVNTGITSVQLDPESARYFREIYEKAHDIHNTISIKDNDGVPMVYSSRSNNENVKDIALCLRDVSSSQERITSALDKIEDKIDIVNDKTDSLMMASKKR